MARVRGEAENWMQSPCRAKGAPTRTGTLVTGWERPGAGHAGSEAWKGSAQDCSNSHVSCTCHGCFSHYPGPRGCRELLLRRKTSAAFSCLSNPHPYKAGTETKSQAVERGESCQEQGTVPVETVIFLLVFQGSKKQLRGADGLREGSDAEQRIYNLLG